MGHRISLTRVFLLAALIFLALAGTASAYQFTLATPIPHQQQVQRAISFQVNRQVSKHWQIDPVSFTASGGIPITVASDISVGCNDASVEGCHVWNGQQMSIYVERGHPWDGRISGTISHEIIETEINPHADRDAYGQQLEICDPVGGFDGEYELMHVWVEDFTYPDYWYGGPARPHHYDHSGSLYGPVWEPPPDFKRATQRTA